MLRPWLRRPSVGALSVLIVCALGGPALADGPSPTWIRKTGFRAAAVSAAPRSAIVVGVTGASRESQVAVVRAFRPDGTIRWTTAWAPAAGWAGARAVAVSSDGIFVAGAMGPDVAAPPCDEIGSFTPFVLALSDQGRVLWQRGDTDWRNCHSESAGSIGAGGGTVTVGVTRYIEGYADYHGRILGFTTEGRRIWSNAFEVPGIPWSSADSVNDLATDLDGRTFAAGEAWSRAVLDPPFDSEAILQALDRGGGRRWSRVFGESSRWVDDRDRGTGVDVRGRRVLFGAMIDLEGSKVQARVMSFTIGGHRRWVRSFPAAAAYAARAHVALGRSGGAYAAIPVHAQGGRGPVAVLRAFADDGRVLWMRTLQGHRVQNIDAGRGLYVLERGRLLRFPG